MMKQSPMNVAQDSGPARASPFPCLRDAPEHLTIAEFHLPFKQKYVIELSVFGD
ncbi:hypothetical protein [Paraburkholderia sp. GAS334]|jgi:hypothetical protein|uniref:hypothetical protein n=1 Tax=unclassified Paraburkholderia TaxID=2615204 RepID=UPI003D22C2F3